MEYDEHEQGERVRNWLRQNGSSLITGVAMGLLLVFGWQWWQGRGLKHQEEASLQYQSLTEAIKAKDDGKVKVLASQVREKFKDTAFAGLVALRQAAYLHEGGHDDQALALLRSARPEVKDAGVAEIFDVRIARLLLISGKADEAERALAKVVKPHYPQVVDELRGDIAIARGKRDEARKNYERALGALDQAAPTRPLLELKLIDAGGQPPTKPET